MINTLGMTTVLGYLNNRNKQVDLYGHVLTYGVSLLGVLGYAQAK
jgi:hypothetical protein